MKQIKLKNCPIGRSYYKKHNISTRSAWQVWVGIVLLLGFSTIVIIASLDILDVTNKDNLVCNFITNCFEKGEK